MSASGSVRLLLRTDLKRFGAALRHPTAGGVIGVALPLVLVTALLWAIGPDALPDVTGAEGAVSFGMLIAAVPGLFSYNILFRGSDAPFLRRLGLSGRALFWERSVRLLALVTLVVGGMLIPFAAGGLSIGRPLAIAAGAGLAAWATSLLSMAGASRALSGDTGSRPGLLGMGFKDPELAKAAPLVYAPLIPFLTGVFAAGYVGAAAGASWSRCTIIAILCLIPVRIAAGSFEAALPRFAPRALEMAFAPPPRAGQGAMAVGREVTRLIPRRTAAVWVRDSTVGARRYSWAARMVWPLALIGFFALARWGDDPSTRAWVVAAGALALIVQGGAVVALGRMERSGPHWVDRAVGLGLGSRLAGRWMWGWGLSLWLGVPFAIAWSWLAGAEHGWAWLAVGALTGGVASAVSVAVAAWR